MLRFLRRFRFKQAATGAVKKYLLYGIGEIILVVLGILIAIQINNWNDAKKNRDQEHKILTELKTELVNNKQQLDQLISDRKISLAVCRALLPSFSRRSNLTDLSKIDRILGQRPPSRVVFASGLSSKMDSLIGSLPSYSLFNPRMGNIKSIIYSGKLSLITHPQIKICIAEFEDRTKSIEITTRGADKIMNENIQPILREYLRNNASYPLDQFFRDFDLRFFIENYTGWTTAVINASMGFSKTMEVTIQAIEAELGATPN
ncbi:MAG: DUF6090 family protein [Bacteroidota bacterium]